MSGPSAPARSRICALGDALLDIIVEIARQQVPDDDVPATIRLAPGGQAANVAAWCVSLGTPAAVITKLGDDPGGRLTRELLASRNVSVLTPPDEGGTGAVVSLVSDRGYRTMLSDRGTSARLGPGDLQHEWFAGCSWLHLSGYALLGPAEGSAALLASELARSRGARVSADLSSVTVVAATGPVEARRRLTRAGAEIVFANEAEARALGEMPAATLVIKRGPAGCRVVSGGRQYEMPAAPGGTIRDTTGAGDAFAAGWLVGGPSLAVRTARACIGQPGAMPPTGWRP